MYIFASDKLSSKVDENPKLSVLMTVFNGSEFLKTAIESVIRQSFKSFEFIIINDGSTDESGLIIKAFRDKRIKSFHFEEKKGVSYRRQQLLDMAQGEFLNFIDADDYFHPQKFEKQIAFLEQNPDFVLVGSSVVFVNEKDNKTSSLRLQANEDKILPILIFRNYFVNSAVMFRKSALRDLQIPDNFDFVEDYYLWWKLLQRGKGKNLNEQLTFYRLHRNSMTQHLADKRFEADKHIYSVILHDLGISPTNNDLRSHYFISKGQKINSFHQIAELSEWMNKLKIHIRISGIKNYKSTLLNRWLKICRKSLHRPDILVYSLFLLMFRHKFFLN
ncbi:MAG TPA: glycosyltransferase [Bacteroidia bacterium]|nr:glycosyltransferase [Bacteroidia bacterium]HRS58676.1 glycosyltransferase [Bacteroidia bacterium]HRU68299.1 glycosyltransferase [Bacteroidia bacterium]